MTLIDGWLNKQYTQKYFHDAMPIFVFCVQMTTRIECQSKLLLSQQHNVKNQLEIFGIQYTHSTKIHVSKNLNAFFFFDRSFFNNDGISHHYIHLIHIFIVSILGFVYLSFKLFAFQCLHPPPSYGMQHAVRYIYTLLY